MQEEVEQRTLALVMNGTKLTGRMLKAALTKYLAYVKEHKRESQATADVIPHGKQTVQELIGQNQGVSNIEINDPSIRAFERIARKYGVDYAIKKDRSSTPPKYLVFFKGRDADALTAAFTEYTNKKVKQAERQPLLQRFKVQTRDQPNGKAPAGRRNDERRESQKAAASMAALRPDWPLRHQPGRSLAAGSRYGCLSKAAGSDGLHPPGLCRTAAELPPL